MKEAPEVVEFQIHQLSFDKSLIKLITSPLNSIPSREKIEGVIKGFIGDDVVIEFELCSEIPLTKSGKRRITVSHLEA